MMIYIISNIEISFSNPQICKVQSFVLILLQIVSFLVSVTTKLVICSWEGSDKDKVWNFLTYKTAAVSGKPVHWISSILNSP